MQTPSCVAYALLWLSFGALHSVLAQPKTKALFDQILGHRYRLTYNLIAAAHILLVIAIGRQLYRDASPLELVIWQTYLAKLASLSGIVVILFALRQYDLGLFSGIKQWRNGRNPAATESIAEPLNIQGLNRFVRHPLYTGAFLYLWGNATSSYGVMTALWGSVYLLIGTWFEERQLVNIYGESYRDYKSNVPAYIPWKGQAI